MKSIQVFDPALCCSTGVCGVDVDQALVGFSADVDWARQNGAHIERFNLAQQPVAFAQNSIVRSFLERSGQEALPLILMDGEVALAGRSDRLESLGYKLRQRYPPRWRLAAHFVVHLFERQFHFVVSVSHL